MQCVLDKGRYLHVPFSFWSKVFWVFHGVRVWWFIVSNKIDLIDVNYIGLNSLLAFFLFRRKVSATCWGSDIHSDPKRSMLNWLINWIALIQANVIFVCGKTLSRKLVRTFPFVNESKIVVYSPGVDSRVFSPSEVTTKRKYDFVSTRLVQEKYNIHTIIEALIIARAKGFDFKVAIVVIKPDLNYYSAIKNLIERHLPSSVDFYDELTPIKLKELYMSSKSSIHLPPNEGIGLSVVESLLCNCIPMVLPHPAYFDYLSQDEVILVNSATAQDVLRSMEVAVAHEWNMSLDRQLQIIKLHSAETNLIKNLNVIKRLNFSSGV